MNYTLPDDSLHQEIQISPYLSNGIIDRSEDVQTQRDYKFPFFYFRDFNKALSFVEPDFFEDLNNIHTYSINSRIEYLLDFLSLKNIGLPDPSGINDYLIEYPGIIYFVEPVANMVTEHFDRNSQISLEVYHDPEIDDSYLVIYVRQNPYSEDIIELIDEINELIAYNLSCDVSGWVSVTTDFNFPK